MVNFFNLSLIYFSIIVNSVISSNIPNDDIATIDDSYIDTDQGKAISNCTDALSNFKNIDVLNVLNAATTSMSNFTFWASDLGNYDLCMGFPTLEASSTVSENSLWHCVAGSTQLKMNSVQSLPFGGLCIPVACSEDHLKNASLLVFVDQYVNNFYKYNASELNTQFGQQLISYFIKLDAILNYGQQSNSTYTCGSNSHEMTFDRKAILFMFIILLLLTFASTFYHMSTAGRDGSDPWIIPVDKNSFLKRSIDAFSLIKNVPVIFEISTGSNGERFAVLDGLRVISIIWILFSHTFALVTGVGMLNSDYVMPPSGFLVNWYYQIIFSARFAVDTFFFISGFLVVKSLLKKLDISPSDTSSKLPSPQIWIPMMYLHRFMRILPLYLFCLLFWWKIGVMMGDGPLWYHWDMFIGII